MILMLFATLMAASLSAQLETDQGIDVSTSPFSGEESSIKDLVDDTNLKVRSLLKGRPSVTGVPTYINGITMGSGAAITFGDATTQNTAPAAEYVPKSSATYGSVSGTTSDTAFAGCNIVGSTLTITVLADSSIEASFSGSVTNATLSTNFHMWVLVDGTFPYPYTSALTGSAMTGGRPNADYGETVNASFATETGLLSAGSHSLCLAWSSDTTPHATGTWSFVGGNRFRIKEIQH